MTIKQDVQDLKTKAADLSMAFRILSDYKKTNVRFFVIILFILSMWILTIGYLIYTLNDINTIEETTENTQEISEVEAIENSNIVIGDQYGENKTNIKKD